MDTTSSRRGRHTVPALLCAIALVAACGNGDGPTPDPVTEPTDAQVTRTPEQATPTEGVEPSGDEEEPADAVVIVISDFAYEVPETVAPGAEVTVTNEDTVGHTVTSDEDGLFDVAVDPGATVSFTAPEEVGEYGFFCIPHPHMTATLAVG